MTAPAPESTEAARAETARSADLSELLGHLATSWDDERRLLARQMHDNLGSAMTALTMHLGLLAHQMPAEKNLQDRAAQMKHLLMNIIETNREMQLALWNDKLEFLGVKAAISELVGQFGAAHQLTARASLPDEDDNYGRAQGVALLRTVEEGLRNVAAHARASEVDVILDDNDEEVMLTVRDNGAGPLDAALADGTHARHGLRLLRERARYLGGELRFGAAPRGGAQLTIALPKQGPQGQ